MWHVNDFDNSVLIDFIKYRPGNNIKCRRDLHREATIGKTSWWEEHSHARAFSSNAGLARSKWCDVFSRVR
jgi:hypothetical protein